MTRVPQRSTSTPAGVRATARRPVAVAGESAASGSVRRRARGSRPFKVRAVTLDRRPWRMAVRPGGAIFRVHPSVEEEAAATGKRERHTQVH